MPLLRPNDGNGFGQDFSGRTTPTPHGPATKGHPILLQSETEESALLAAEISRLQRRVAELEAEKALSRMKFRALEEKFPIYQRIPAALPDTLILAFDLNLRFVLAEGSLMERLGYRSADLVGRCVVDSYSLPDAQSWRRWEPQYRSVLSGQRISRIIEENSRYYQVDLLPTRDEQGVINGGLHIMRDISTEHGLTLKAEARASAMAQDNHSLNNYISNNLELEQFAYIAAHDLKEPIRTIISFAQLLERRHADGLNEEGHEFIEYIVQGSRRMEALINGLLQYSSLDKQEAKKPELIRIDEILDGVLRNLAQQINERQVEVIYSSLPSLRADPVHLGQLFQNLVSNAIKFNTSDKPEIRIEGEIDSRQEGNYWKFSVHDNGIGIPRDGMDKIFGIFKRLHSRDEYEGAGIGLALCRKIVEGHGGRIWVESTPGKGASFYFTLPRLVRE